MGTTENPYWMTLKKWLGFDFPASEVLLHTTMEEGRQLPLPYPLGISGLGLAGLPIRPEEFSVAMTDKDKTIFCSALFSNRMGRNAAASYCGRHDWINPQPLAVTRRYKPADYIALLRASKLTLSPRGAGADSHRNYEALLHKVVPIIESSELLEVKYRNLPVILVDSFQNLDFNQLRSRYRELLAREYNFEPLTRSYWIERGYPIDRQSRYWLQRSELHYFTRYFDPEGGKHASTLPHRWFGDPRPYDVDGSYQIP